MATFALIHGGGDVGWYWHLVEGELRRQGHAVVAPDLPCEDNSAGLSEYADTVIEAIDAIGCGDHLVIVAQSYGGFTAPLVAERMRADLIVLVTAMVPAPGEAPADWWDNTGYQRAVQQQARLDGGKTGSEDPVVAYYHDVPRGLAEEAMSKAREAESDTAYHAPWPLTSWPDVPTRFVLCSEDRFFPPDFMRRIVSERLGITPDEIAAGHCVALSRPQELADRLVGYAAAIATP
jgi:pimeloyl-ACP methyl ester carboxylesterase